MDADQEGSHPRLEQCTFGAVQVALFDVQQRTVAAELTVPFVKYVVWSADMEHVGLLSKHAIVIADKKLSNACTGAPWLQLCFPSPSELH